MNAPALTNTVLRFPGSLCCESIEAMIPLPPQRQYQWTHLTPTSWFLNTFLRWRKLEILGGITDSRAGTGKIQNKPETSWAERNVQRMKKLVKRTHKKWPYRVLFGQVWKNLSIKKIMIVTDYNRIPWAYININERINK